MTEENESFFSVLSSVRKFHPVALVLIVVFVMLTANIWNFDVSLEKKIVPLIMSGSLYCLISFFESYRIEKQNERKEEACRDLTGTKNITGH